MATDTSDPAMERLSPQEINQTIGSIKKMLMVGAIFAIVGYLLVISALVLEVTQFHPALESFFGQFTQHSLAGGGPDRAGSAALNQQLAEIHKFPSTLLWLKLGGIAHILMGIFITLAAIIRALSMMPHRLSYELDRA